jgi:hypothetical protein
VGGRIGSPVVFFPGMEGSGESCMHLVVPTLERLAARGAGHRLVLVDYADEQHTSFDALSDTIAALLAETPTAWADTTFWGQSFGNLMAVSVARGMHTARAAWSW